MERELVKFNGKSTKIAIIKIGDFYYLSTKKGTYQSKLSFPTYREAYIEAIKDYGRMLQRQLDGIQKKLEDMGAVSESDPAGWRC